MSDHDVMPRLRGEVLRGRVRTMRWMVAVLAATSGFTMSFAVFAFIWTWYVGSVVLWLSQEDGTRVFEAS